MIDGIGAGLYEDPLKAIDTFVEVLQMNRKLYSRDSEASNEVKTGMYSAPVVPIQARAMVLHECSPTY